MPDYTDVETTPQQNPVWGDLWNPDPNAFSPSATPVGVWGIGEPSHGDDPNARPETPSYGVPDSGTTQDTRANLLTDVKQRGALPPPPQVIRHEVHTYESGAEAVRIHQETVNGVVPTTILMQNRKRKRALVKLLSGTTGLVVMPFSASNNSSFTITVPAGQTWQVQSFLFVYTTDGTVGNRTLVFTVRDNLNRTVAQFSATVAQTATQIVTWVAQNGISVDSVVGGTHYFPNIFNGLTLLPGWTIQVVNNGTAGVGDVFGGAQGDVMITPNNVFLVPSRDGGNISASLFGFRLEPGVQVELKTQAAIDAVGALSTDTGTLFVYEELIGELLDEPGVSS